MANNRGTLNFNDQVHVDAVATFGEVDKRKTCWVCGMPRWGYMDDRPVCYHHAGELWRAKGAYIEDWRELEGKCTRTYIAVPPTGRLIAGQNEIITFAKAREIGRLKSVFETLVRGWTPGEIFQDWIAAEGSGLVDAEGKAY